MSGNDRYARYAALTGVLFVIAIVVGFLVQPKPPASDASAVEVLEYVKDHQDALHVVQLIFAVSIFFFIWFIGALRSFVGGAEGGQGRLATTAYGGALIAVGALIASLGIAAAAELHPARDPEITHAMWDASVLVFAVAAPAAAVFLVGNGLAILRTGYLPSWMGWFGLVTALFNALPIGAVFTDSGAFAADGVLGLWVGFVTFLVWVALASILIYRKLGEGQAPREGQAPA
jgi:hypothetical protein